MEGKNSKMNSFHQKAEKLKQKFENEIREAKLNNHGNVYDCSLHKKEEEEFVHERYDKSSWQFRLMHVFESHTFEMFLLILLAVDIIIVLTEIFLDAEFPSCDIIEYRGYTFSCCPGTTGLAMDNNTVSGDDSNHRYLETISEQDHHHTSCLVGEIGSFAAGCDDHDEILHLFHELLFGLSTSILVFFEIELLLKIYILRTLFFKNVFLALDFFIVSISLGVDIGFHYSSRLVAEIAGLLVIARAWRVIRVVHGVYMEIIETQCGTQDRIEKVTDNYIEEVEALVHEITGHYESMNE